MSPVVEHSVILGELKELRRSGLVRLRSLGLPELRGIVAELPDGSVEGLIRAAVGRLDQGSLRTAAEYTLGLAPGTRDWPGADRRKRAAEVYGVSVERFRKDHELMVLGEVAEEIGRVARAAAAPGPHGPPGPARQSPSGPPGRGRRPGPPPGRAPEPGPVPDPAPAPPAGPGPRPGPSPGARPVPAPERLAASAARPAAGRSAEPPAGTRPGTGW